MKIGFQVNPSPVNSTLRIHNCFLYMLAAVKANTRRPKVLYILVYVNSEIPKTRKKQICGRLWCMSQPRSNAWWFAPLCSRHVLWPHPVCHLLHVLREDLYPKLYAVWKSLNKEEKKDYGLDWISSNYLFCTNYQRLGEVEKHIFPIQV